MSRSELSLRLSYWQIPIKMVFVIKNILRYVSFTHSSIIYIENSRSSSQQVTRKGLAAPVVPRLCGLLTGQHVIYDQDRGAGPASLVVRRTAASSRWRIKIVQLEATDPGIAPRLISVFAIK